MNSLLQKIRKRVALQPVVEMKECCVQTALSRFPSVLGTKVRCEVCEQVLKAVEASDFSDLTYIGALGETKRREACQAPVFSRIWFSKKYYTLDEVKSWVTEFRGCDNVSVKKIYDGDDFICVYFNDVEPATVRAFNVTRGVIGEIGLPFERSITTAALVGGGHINPYQGGVTSFVRHVSGHTDVEDGHSHYVSLVSKEGPQGPELHGLTSVEHEHAHMVSALFDDEGGIDCMTHPAASNAGGHSHRHRFVWTPSSVIRRNMSSERIIVSPGDIARIRRAATMLDNLMTRKGLCASDINKVSGVPKGTPGEVTVDATDKETLLRLVELLRSVAEKWEKELRNLKETVSSMPEEGKKEEATDTESDSDSSAEED